MFITEFGYLQHTPAVGDYYLIYSINYNTDATQFDRRFIEGYDHISPSKYEWINLNNFDITKDLDKQNDDINKAIDRIVKNIEKSEKALND